MRRSILACLVAVLAAACMRTLPDQDRRILDSAPQAKLSADILWKEFAANAPDADRRYHGRALLVTGVVTTVSKDAAPPAILFAQAAGHGVRAELLDDEAGGIVASAEAGQRLTLKCFCQGLQGDIVLKSCVKP